MQSWKIGCSLLFIFVLTLHARENPFFPVTKEKIPNYSTNIVKKPPPFHSAKVNLPDTARVLKSVTLTYQNLDGSLSNKSIDIARSIDWHEPIVIMQKNKKLTKAKSAFTLVGKLPFIRFYAAQYKMKILTKDQLIRHFKLPKPDRIVLDFKREDDFRTYTFKAKTPFLKITIGNHAKYYRVVVLLDGHYGYRLKPLKNGCLLQLF